MEAVFSSGHTGESGIANQRGESGTSARASLVVEESEVNWLWSAVKVHCLDQGISCAAPTHPVPFDSIKL